MNKMVIVCGPTASGKSDLAVWLAKKIGGEIISADSRQVYKGLDIGTGKITKNEMKGVPHYLLDVITPKKRFSVSYYKKLADKAVQKIFSKHKTPIICGGTGFYIDAMVNNISLPNVPPNPSLRKKLEILNARSLFTILRKMDPKRASSIDKNNKVRLIRAIEIAKHLGRVPEIKTDPKFSGLWLGVSWQEKILKQRIYKRLIARIKQGMIDEVKKLHKKGLSWKRMNELGLEYRYIAQYLQGKLTKEQMTQKLNSEIWHYAKRQMTWFKKNKNIRWFSPVEKDKIYGQVKSFLVKRDLFETKLV